jgi:hypothetical protein
LREEQRPRVFENRVLRRIFGPKREEDRSWRKLCNDELHKSRDNSVGIAMGYGLDDRGSRVRFPVGAGNFSLHHRVHNGSGAHPASYPMGSRGSFPYGKAAGA